MWYAGNVVAALILVQFIIVFGRPRPLLAIRMQPAYWFLIVLISFGLAIISYFPNSFLTIDQQCLTSALFLPFYLVTAYWMGMIGVVTILLIGGILSNLSYSQGIAVCYVDGILSLEWGWFFKTLISVCFLLLASYWDHKKMEE